MTKFSHSSGDYNSPTVMEKPAPEFEYDDDDDNFTTPTAAPSRSLEEDDEEDEEQYQSTIVDEASAALPPQTSDVFHDGVNKNAANNVPVAPTFPSHGALGRFDSDYGDESQGVGDEEDEELSFLDNNGSFDGTHADEEREKLKGDGEAVSSSLPHATDAPEERRFSCSSNNGGEFMPQSFRPFQSRNSEDNPINANLTGDMPALAAEEASNDINTTAPQCRRTPSIITSSEASYIFQQLDELRTAPSGILYSQPKYLQPTNMISGNKFADSLSIDAIHAISSYCDEKSWMALCHTSKQWRGVGYDVWRKVRMHAFRCAGEVLLAWVSSCFLLCA